ncbi:MAG: disulfide bond formation protein B, partial [Pseudomonadota bacterium]
VFVPVPALLALGALAALATAGVGGYHVGVEQGWWQGPTSCSSAPVGSVDADALFDQIMSAPLVRCDDIAWQLAGISMAGWNMILSLGLAVIWVAALRKR